ncbi:MAG: hypothetical protein ABI823_05530 [Bryobacteraceae bacterium]
MSAPKSNAAAEANKPAAELRWPGFVALLAVGGLHYALPSELTVGPDWILTALIVLFAIPKIISDRAGRQNLYRIFGHLTSGLVTADMIASLALLIWRLPKHEDSPQKLLLAASLLWTINVLVFASWYWRLDAGGPHGRDSLAEKAGGFHADGAFLFPQMTMSPDLLKRMGEGRWRPGFVDYLFLAFNTSTAFSPTDVPVLSRWAKALMMVQSVISLTTIAIIAARAVNIL